MGQLPTVGGTIVVSLDSYRPPQAGQPPARKVLSRHSLPALQGAQGLGASPDKRAVNTAPGRKKKIKKTPALRLASWNVRTMCPGLTDDLQQVDDARRTAVIDRELARLNIDIACLQETRLADYGSIRESHYTFFWRGLPRDSPRRHGVGFAVRNSLSAAIEPPTEGTERILNFRLSTTAGFINILSVYAPTLCATQEDKDQFYQALDEAISRIPSTEGLYLLGDFNARVGADYNTWPSCLGHHGIGRMNENGQRLLELCCHRDLCVTNTYFKCKDHHKVSWRHPRSRHWHQLDLIITRRVDLRSILHTRSFHSADCDTDHSLICSKVRLTPKRIHHSKTRGLPRINTCSTGDPHRVQIFRDSLSERLSTCTPKEVDADSRWGHIRDSIYTSALTAFGKRERRNADWYEAHWEEIHPVTEAKRKALLAYKQNPCPSTRDALRAARNKAQQIARRCANDYWLNLCRKIQSAADTGNARGMYNGIKIATGPTATKTAPLKSKIGEPITDQGKQLERWVEHYLELYATQNVVTAAALEALPSLTVMEELDIPPTEEELRKAIDGLTCGKAPGKDGIPPEVLKSGKLALLRHLHELLCLCWEKGHVPQDMRDANIITLYKNKGDRSDCNNYRGISLLSVVGKVFARVVLTRLQSLASRVYPESQCGFRSGRSTVDMIFSLRQLQEKCREQQKPLYIAFIDLTKAFDLVSRGGLFSLLQKIGCPPKLLQMVTSFHEDMQSTVCFNGGTSEAFPVSSGVKQGCVLAPTLFGIFFSMLLQYAFADCEEGILVRSRADGKLFNIARLRAKTKVRKVLIREMLFADDAALTSHTEAGLQELVNRLSHACKEFGLTISLKKTNILAQGTDKTPFIFIDSTQLEVVETFTYLGSTIASSLSLDTEISSRIGKAAAVMAKLNKRVWNNNSLTINTKVRVYQACVLGTLLYGSESWTTYTGQERRLNSFHLRCLRRLLQIKWQDRVPNTEVLQRTGIPSMFALLSRKRLRWLGHVRRMDDGRIPKDLLYGELWEGSRPAGRPRLRYRDSCRRDMKAAEINHNTWEDLAEDRQAWKASVSRGVSRAETTRSDQLLKKRAERKERASSERAPTLFRCSNCSRDCHSRVGLHSHSRRCQPRT